eukprot:CAMPEP_0183749600 /NCGR_PEP_ID=MMETSP0739-20130205/47_1 /TAXON_ID=385413 /ORGANISM="Thalassiosira miniscula, Strain CCMP1093" /LENGTH=330 /DNA_ID=CAMNT_0025985363 /DNA_START=269 /DNA_END=1261 /DNA_ORIENTATION=-
MTDKARINRIAQLQSEIETRQAEIDRLRLEAAHGYASKKPSAPIVSKHQEESMPSHQPMGCQIELWERRLDQILRNAQRIIPIAAKLSEQPGDDDDSCDTSVTESISDDDTIESSADVIRAHMCPSSRRPTDITSELAALQARVRESDQKIESLQAVISENAGIVVEMKETIQGYVAKMKEKSFSLTLHQRENETLKDQCARLGEMVAKLEKRNSSNEDVIEFLKSQLVKQLAQKGMVEDELSMEVAHRDETISSLEKSSALTREQSTRKIRTLEARNSCLEDEVEQLKAANGSLEARCVLIEEEKNVVEEELKTEMELFRIANTLHDII